MSDQQTSHAAMPQSMPEASPTVDHAQLLRWIQWTVAAVVVVLLALIAIAKFATRAEIPGCDSTAAKDALSDILKKTNVDATRYDEIKTLTTLKDMVTCNAMLTLRNDSNLVIDYRIYQEGGSMKLMITRSNP